MTFKLSKNSQERLETCDERLIIIVRDVEHVLPGGHGARDVVVNQTDLALPLRA